MRVEEPLLESASQVRKFAMSNCAGAFIDRQQCGWYHSVWQYLRIVDMASTPTWHTDFYREAFMSVLNTRPNARILVSGAADYSLVAHLRSASFQTGAEPEITVLDICPTPLFACKWYASHFNFPVSTVTADVLRTPFPESYRFDLITTDAFLTRFSREDAAYVAKFWSGALNPHGLVVTTVRARSSEPESIPRASDADLVSEYVARAVDRYSRVKHALDLTPVEFERMVLTYATRMKSFNLGSINDISSLITEAGLSILDASLATVAGEMQPTEYARIIATHQGANDDE